LVTGSSSEPESSTDGKRLNNKLCQLIEGARGKCQEQLLALRGKLDDVIQDGEEAAVEFGATMLREAQPQARVLVAAQPKSDQMHEVEHVEGHQGRLVEEEDKEQLLQDSKKAVEEGVKSKASYCLLSEALQQKLFSQRQISSGSNSC
jgi:hypothetical protein